MIGGSTAEEEDIPVVEEEEQMNSVIDSYQARKQQDKAMKNAKTAKGSALSLPSNFDKLSMDIYGMVALLRPDAHDHSRRLKLLMKLQRFVDNYWPGTWRDLLVLSFLEIAILLLIYEFMIRRESHFCPPLSHHLRFVHTHTPHTQVFGPTFTCLARVPTSLVCGRPTWTCVWLSTLQLAQ